MTEYTNIIFPEEPVVLNASRGSLTTIEDAPDADVNIALLYDLNAELLTAGVAAPYTDGTTIFDPLDSGANVGAIATFMSDIQAGFSSLTNELSTEEPKLTCSQTIVKAIGNLFDKTPELNDLLGSGPVTIDPAKVEVLLSGSSIFFSASNMNIILDGAAERSFIGEFDEVSGKYPFQFPPETGMGIKVEFVDSDITNVVNKTTVNIMLIQPPAP